MVTRVGGASLAISALPSSISSRLRSTSRNLGIGFLGARICFKPCLARASQNVDDEGTLVDEDTLQQRLNAAVEEEDYVLAAKLRDDLRVLHEDSKAAVLAANSRFYSAFRRGDLAAMRAIWAKGDNISCVHPGAGNISGRDLVMDSWDAVCGIDHDFPIKIELKDVQVHVRGDVGYVTCMEVVKTKGSSWGAQVATNVFERINGQWFICVHHASHVDL
ncbi:nuclear transport factor 2 (NTF2) family protein isoform X2 [Wolffia australiana]